MPPSVDSVFRLVDREVWIVTASAGDRRGGLCATWVSLASLDPERPVLVAGLAPNHFTAELVQSAGSFGLHLLRTDQAAVALNFALGSGRDRDKLANLAMHSGRIGVPLLDDCLARLECQVIARYDSGDRYYFWADVIEGQTLGPGESLCEHAMIAAASDEQKQLLAENRRHDADVLRPLHDRWRGANLFRPGGHL